MVIPLLFRIIGKAELIQFWFGSSFFDCDCYGIDPSEDLLDQCINKDVKLIKANAENIPFDDDFFDIVISITAIHNFEDIEKGLLEMKRVGKDKFVFSILKKANQFNKIEELIEKKFKVRKKIDEGIDMIYWLLNWLPVLPERVHTYYQG